MIVFKVRSFVLTAVASFAVWLCCAAQVSAEAPLQPVTLQLKWQHQFQFAGYYAALEKGYYAAAGFDVTLLEYKGGGDLFEPVLAGDIEFGLADSSIVVKRLQGNPVVVLTTVFQHSPLVLISLKESGILSPYEFIGKKVMFQLGADDASIQAMLTTLGVRPTQYEQVPHNFDNFALVNEETPVDVMSAYLSNQPFMYQEQGFDVQIINPANYGIDFYGDLIYSSEAYVRKNPDRAIAFRDASLLGWQYALQHPDEVIEWLQTKYTSKKSKAALQYEANVIRQMVAPDFVALGSLYPERFSRISDIYKQLKLAPTNGDLVGFTLAEYLESEANDSRRLLQVIGTISIVLAIALGVLVLIMRSLRLTVKRRTEELNQTNRALSHQLELTDRYVISSVVGIDGNFRQVSSALCQSSGYTQDELLLMNANQLASADTLELRQQAMEQVLQGNSWQGELQYTRKDGSEFWVFIFMDPMIDSAGHISGIRSTATDITEKKMIQHLSETDGLTGIANRNKIDDALAIEWARFQRYGQAFALILFDLDHFKKVNDQYGHLEGDNVLIRVAKLVQSLLRKIDVIGRWGGEEFVIILPQTDLPSAVLVAQKIRVAISEIRDLRCSHITASFGVAVTRSDFTDSDVILQRADEALYVAKENGRNQVAVMR